jgi:hypothetical protein
MTEKPTTQPPDNRSKEAGGCAKVFAFLLALVLVVIMPLALLAFDMYRVVFNPPLMKRVLADEVVKHDLIPIALEWFSDRRAQERIASGEALAGADEPDIVLLMSFMDRQDWNEVKAEVLPAEILEEWVGVTVDGTYAWIDSDYRVPQITWDLTIFKVRVNTEHGLNAILIAYDNLPPCTQAEVDDFVARAKAAAPEDAPYNLCVFPDPWHDDQFNDYVNAVKDVVKNIPDQLALTDELAQNVPDEPGVGPTAIKQELRIMRLVAQWAWLLPLILLALIFLMVRIRSLQSLSRWWGLPLLAGGFLTLLPAIVYNLVITNLLASGPLSEVPELIQQEAIRAVVRLAGEIFQPMLIQAAVIVLVAIVLIALHRMASRKKPAPAKSA